MNKTMTLSFSLAVVLVLAGCLENEEQTALLKQAVGGASWAIQPEGAGLKAESA